MSVWSRKYAKAVDALLQPLKLSILNSIQFTGNPRPEGTQKSHSASICTQKDVSERRGLRSSLKERGRDLIRVLHTAGQRLVFQFQAGAVDGERECRQTGDGQVRGPAQGAVQSSRVLQFLWFIEQGAFLQRSEDPWEEKSIKSHEIKQLHMLESSKGEGKVQSTSIGAINNR